MEDEGTYDEEAHIIMEEANQQAIVDGNNLAEIMTMPGWKLVAAMADRISHYEGYFNAIRNKIEGGFKGGNKIELLDVAYHTGQVDGVEKLMKAFNLVIQRRDKLLREK